jgi:methylmalonyl-CoA mutase cobalamin-binding subunit
MGGRLFLNLDGQRLTAILQQSVNEILADAVEFDAHLVVRSISSGLVKVEYQGAPSELKRVALLDGFK